MSFAPQNFRDRQAHSARAKKVLRERIQARPQADAPIMAQRRSEREAIALACAQRDTEKSKARAAVERLAAVKRARIDEERRRAEKFREAAGNPHPVIAARLKFQPEATP